MLKKAIKTDVTIKMKHILAWRIKDIRNARMIRDQEEKQKIKKSKKEIEMIKI